MLTNFIKLTQEPSSITHHYAICILCPHSTYLASTVLYAVVDRRFTQIRPGSQAPSHSGVRSLESGRSFKSTPSYTTLKAQALRSQYVSVRLIPVASTYFLIELAVSHFQFLSLIDQS